jgi:hypothetical protein
MVSLPLYTRQFVNVIRLFFLNFILQIGFLNVCLFLRRAVSPHFNHHAVATVLNTRVKHHTKHGASPVKILLETYSYEDALVETSNA